MRMRKCLNATLLALFVGSDTLGGLVHPHASHFQKDSQVIPILAIKMFLRVRVSIFETDP